MENVLLYERKCGQYAINLWLENVELSPKIKEMEPFEKDQLPEKVKRRHKGSQTIKKSLVFAVKTSNIYKLDTHEYNKINN